MAVERNEVCLLLDKLSLDMLRLMEDRVKCQMNVENAVNAANIQLAKSRYVMGHNNVSAVQLPTEGSQEFSALSTLEKDHTDELLIEEKYLVNTRKSEVDSEFVNPVKWFGVLVPQNLHQAQSMFTNSLQYIIESLNVQKQLESTCDAISKLRLLKIKLNPEE